MKIPEPGQTADVTLRVTFTEYSQLTLGVDKINAVVAGDNAEAVASRLAAAPRVELVRFVKVARILAKFIEEEIIEG